MPKRHVATGNSLRRHGEESNMLTTRRQHIHLRIKAWTRLHLRRKLSA